MALLLNDGYGLYNTVAGALEIKGWTAGAATRCRTWPRRRPRRLAATTTEVEYPVRQGGQLVSTEVLLGVAGTTATTLRVFRNGVQVGSDITVPASSLSVSPYIGAIRFAKGDRVKVRCVTAGAGASDVTVTLTAKG